MKKLLLIVLLNSLLFGNYFKRPTINKALRLQKEAKQLCQRYRGKKEKYIASKRDDVIAKHAIIHYTHKIAKYCTIKN